MSRVSSIRPTDLLGLAWRSLRRNRLRTFLTVGAIAFGIAVMMFLIALGYGLQEISLGNTERSPALLSVSVTTPSAELQPLNAKAVQRISTVGNTKEILPQFTLKGEMALDNHRAPITVVAADPSYLQLDNASKLVAGRYYRKDDQQTMVVTTGFLKLFGLEQKKTPLVIFNLKLDADLYPDLPELTDINVTGVIDSGSNAVIAYLPRTYLEKQFTADTLPQYKDVKVTVPNLDAIQPVKADLIALGFKVDTVIDTVDQIKKVFYYIRLVLGSLGLLAIFVASIGMFNTLTISLLERTKEIGIMKALGVKRGDIQRLFMAESFLMGLLGGTFGISLAWLLEQITLFFFSLLASLAQQKVPEIFLNKWYVVVGFLVFGIMIAAITGIYPARRAMRLNPIDAIRYE